MSLRSPPAPSRRLRLLPKIVNHDPAEMTIGGRRVGLLSGPWGPMAGVDPGCEARAGTLFVKRTRGPRLLSVKRRAPEAKLEGVQRP